MFASLHNWSFYNEEITEDNFESARYEVMSRHQDLDLVHIRSDGPARHEVMVTSTSVEGVKAFYAPTDEYVYTEPCIWLDVPPGFDPKKLVVSTGAPSGITEMPEIWHLYDTGWKRMAVVTM